MKYSERLGLNAVVPVVVIENAKDAVPTARALLAGGIDVMEITLRTAAAIDSIKAVTTEVPEMLVGAGTVLNLEQAKAVVDAGGKFIVCPGFDPELVKWCIGNDVTVTPGCVTPTEIMAALKLGVDVIKFFPANVYGGLNAMKSLSAPFAGVKFIPTGGVDGKNIAEFAAAPFVHTVGGSWVCTKADITAGNFEKITQLCKEAVETSMGFELAHIGINTESGDESLKVASEFNKYFGFPVKDGNSSAFAGKGIEVMKSMYLGTKGHIAVRTNNIRRAIAYLEKKGLKADMETAKYKGESMIAVYLSGEMGGFAVHLLQK
ncbi:MAG: bifunctional 4-hydroxy-2-oxoglutarate aldolase/2-dehydro-3-deoxy-phosphogluconate aldolase [Oscillospiraceae bacterium]|nr:bifunctional 4-hydroxy-2-oxoglutarate aldolase/2-dehydro-3-deoxy-phosphogluconate aldolase [Oscillospiraceae bacterium]